MLSDRKAAPPPSRHPSDRSQEEANAVAVRPRCVGRPSPQELASVAMGSWPCGLPRRIREPQLRAERCLIVPLSADNRMINMVAGRPFAHEPIPAAIGSRGRENIPDLALLMDAMDLRYCCRLDGSAWGRSAAVSCPLPNGRGRRRLQRPKSLVRSVDRSVMPKPGPQLRGS